MKLRTISQVSKLYGVSTRMLRHYEKIGLLQSQRTDDYAYRMYDENNQIRLQQIIVLRKLRISLKQIGGILSNPNAVSLVEIFTENLNEINAEITALSTMRLILSNFVETIQCKAGSIIEHFIIQ